MPKRVLLGDGFHRSSDGEFKVPKNVEVHFFVKDKVNLGDEPARQMERAISDLADEVAEDNGVVISPDLISAAGKNQEGGLERRVARYPDSIKNYRLESLYGRKDYPGMFRPIDDVVLQKPFVWTPGKEAWQSKDEGGAKAENTLQEIVANFSGLASEDNPLILLWVACLAESSQDEQAAPAMESVSEEGGHRRAPRRMGNRANGCCFITSAVCEIEGLPDDCKDLTLMRAFRDDVLARSQEGRAEINWYYNVAPDILERIQSEPDPKHVLTQLRTQSITPAVSALERADYAAARWHYIAMMERLCRTYGLPGPFQH